MGRRPLGILILGILILLASVVLALIGVAGILVGLAGLLPASGLNAEALLVGGVITLAMAVVLGIAGSGLLALRPWAWWLATVVTLAALVYTGVGLYQAMTRPGGSGNLDLGSAFTVAFLGVLFAYLLTVRNRFRRPIAI
ncbi:MAG TPA: hypothetical protein VJ326_00230 [Thermoplasmata archaeon]|nr:hypothetical protein [Thermoplasmata archaeon]